MAEKKKILILGDHALSPSGCGTQIKYISEALVKSGKFKVIQLGGAKHHENWNPIKIQEYADDWIIIPVKGYGTPDIVRSVIRSERPDSMMIMTDPRFWEWLWQMEDEIRPLLPIVYFHVWDNLPAPTFNRKFYISNDQIVTISKVTSDIVKTVSPEVPEAYFGHAVDPNIFKPLPKDMVTNFRKENFKINGKSDMNRMIFFWNNRNARRKQSGSLIFWFDKFLDKVGRDKATLIMHTDPHDEHGQDLKAIAKELNLRNGELMFSTEKLPPENLAMMYNMADCTINVSDAEGFGLCIESSRPVATIGGCKPISQITEGDYVLSLDGKYHKVLAKSTPKIEEVTQIKTTGCLPLRVTKDHKILCYRQKDFSQNLKLNNHYNTNALSNMTDEQLEKQLEWVPAKDIRPMDRLVFPKLKHIEDLPQSIDILNWISKTTRAGLEYDKNYIWNKHSKNKKTGETIRLNRNVQVNDRFLEFVGWFLAEGCTDKKRSVILDLHKKEESIAQRLGNNFVELFGEVNFSVIKSGKNSRRQNRCRFRVSNGILGEFFSNFCGHTCREKYLNPILMQSPKQLGPLIGGYFNGDGNREKLYLSWRVKSVNLSLLWQVKQVLSANDIYSSIYEQDNSGGFGENNIYQLSTGHCHNKEFCNFISEPEQTEAQDLVVKERKKRPERRWITASDYFLIPVKKTEKISRPMEVIDIQVEGMKNFVVSGVVVHNSTLESLSCGTPIVVNMTGGLQEQVTDGKKWFGVGIEPTSKAIIGSQMVPWIYEDRLSEEVVVEALEKFYKTSKAKREQWSKGGLEHVDKNYNFQKYQENWVSIMEKTIERYGSWETRTGYDAWKIKKIK